jgi:hypothetical protein
MAGDELNSRWQDKQHIWAGDELNSRVDSGKSLLDEVVHVGAGFVAALASSAALTTFYAVLLILSATVAREGSGCPMLLVTERWQRLDDGLERCRCVGRKASTAVKFSQNDFGGLFGGYCCGVYILSG